MPAKRCSTCDGDIPQFMWGCFIALGVVLAGCGSTRVPKQLTSAASPAEVANQAELPFGLSVAQEFNDGKRLYVKAAIDAHARWSTAEAMVSLTGYRDGSEVAKRQVPLASLGPVLEQGSRHEIPIVLDAPAISDYQIELMWGRDSAEIFKADATKPAGSSEAAIELRNVSVRSERVMCDTGQGCELKFSIMADLRNTSGKQVDHAVLGTGFIWLDAAALDLSQRIPENEATVELTGLALGPGASRKVRLVLDRTVPERPDGAYHPVVRVISNTP
jgi:hypothetical protein